MKRGIRCNCICPARVHTPFVDGYLASQLPGTRSRDDARRCPSISRSAAWARPRRSRRSRCTSVRTKRRSSPGQALSDRRRRARRMKLDPLSATAGARTAGRAARRRHARRRLGLRRATTTRRSSAATASRGSRAGCTATRRVGAARAAGVRARRAARAAEQDRLHRPQLPRPRRREQMDLPKEPVMFFKATTALVGPDDDVVIPRGGTSSTGRSSSRWSSAARASYVDEAQRARPRRRLRAAQRLLGARVPARARRPVGQGQELRHVRAARPVPRHARRDRAIRRRSRMWLTVNGETRQKGTTANMVFGVPTLVSYVQPVHDAAARRRDQHRHAGRRRARHEAGAGLSRSRATSSSSASTGSAGRGRRSVAHA